MAPAENDAAPSTDPDTATTGDVQTSSLHASETAAVETVHAPAKAADPASSAKGTSAPKQALSSGKASSSKPSSQAAKLPKTYVIKKGDTLSTISMKFYHSKQHVALLAEYNGILFINEMNVGETIKIPALSSKAASGPGKQNVDYSKVKLPATYLVRVGDTLFTIAMRFYQSQDYVELLAKHNKLSTTEGLKAGTDLIIPAIPTAKKVASTKHVIQEGETLSSISRKYYGSSKYAKSIAAYNRLSDNDVVKSGDVLSIPKVPSI
ncbi:LysM peptidoglycan-binding domain-containing protein [Paenibacillus montanisoli]|uniref:LysM peptidoglycan-binding domain-containing protein n=1 Tax=Paenibacillus montanisoli TaxID=2081970 RepID=UPI001403C85F|nr:LysM domain-containing protein [Paenibacillus montanisoli]